MSAWWNQLKMRNEVFRLLDVDVLYKKKEVAAFQITLVLSC
jgi:hypothetical protein